LRGCRPLEGLSSRARAIARWRRVPRPRAGSQPGREVRRRARPQASVGRRATARARSTTSSQGQRPQSARRHEGAAANEGGSRRHGDRRLPARASHALSLRQSGAPFDAGLYGPPTTARAGVPRLRECRPREGLSSRTSVVTRYQEAHHAGVPASRGYPSPVGMPVLAAIGTHHSLTTYPRKDNDFLGCFGWGRNSVADPASDAAQPVDVATKVDPPDPDPRPRCA
jgi:hypothetical protein